ncbi:lipocalin family protein [Cellulophaga lytica]|uniref:lipocalin family protein n=1 Tax=Cellulophaga lytica TaxID=979 RepID=UPI0026E41B0D|nr:lipocalin family protein [Cellulophaga lytica]MDO6853855.1 lipocalin family protein [Cellulophaga lytica]
MKKIYYLFALLSFSLFITSCNSDDDTSKSDPEVDNATQIIGLWEIDKQFLNGDILPFSDDCQAIETTEFKTDKSFFSVELDSIDGECVDAEPSKGTYSISNSELTLNYTQTGSIIQNDTYIFEILELTSSSLKIKLTSLDVDGDGNNDEYELQYVK